jgi:two-component system chemotaxis response regulator CheY
MRERDRAILCDKGDIPAMYPQKNQLDSKVLIVDDMASTRGLIKDMLRELGFTNVSMARNGREALQKVQDENADLVISDQLMDDMTGTELLEALRKDPKLADIPFIMVSAVRDAPAIDSALDLGVDDYIAKPISMGLLQRKISDVFRRRSATV